MKKRIIIPILFLLIVVAAVTLIVSRINLSSNQDFAESASPASDTSISGTSEHDISVQASPEPEISATESTAPELTVDSSEQEGVQEAVISENNAKSQPSEIQIYETFGSGYLVGRRVYTYDEQGNMLSENSYHMDNEEPGYTYVYTYDEQGRKLTYQYSDQYDHFELTEYIYDELGILTESLSYDKEKELSSRTVYTHDEQGNILKEQEYDKDGNLVGIDSYEYTYDEDGRILTKKNTYNQGSSSTLIEYTYDEDGRILTKKLTKKNTYNQGSSSTLIEYTYDEQGRLSTETWNFGDGFIKHFEYSYDEQGILFEKQQYDNVSDPGGPLIKDGVFKYVY